MKKKIKPKRKINSRTKGHTQERKLVKKFATWWGTAFFRTPGSGSFATRGYKHQDRDLSGDIVTNDPTFPFCIESKKVEGWTLEQLLTSPKCDFYKWWEQTVKETPKGKLPLLVFTKNRTPEFVALLMYDVLKSDADISAFSPYFALNDDILICKLDTFFQIPKENWL